MNKYSLTSLAHSCMIPITGNTTSSFPSTNRALSMGTAPAARMTWIFLGHLLQLHNALQAFRNSWKSFTSLGTFLLRLLLSGWMMFTWRAPYNEQNVSELMTQMSLNYSAFKGVQLVSQNKKYLETFRSTALLCILTKCHTKGTCWEVMLTCLIKLTCLSMSSQHENDLKGGL